MPVVLLPARPDFFVSAADRIKKRTPRWLSPSGVHGSTFGGSNMSHASTNLRGMTGCETDLRRRNESIRALQAQGSLIYAVLTGDSLVKIGLSSDVVTRMHHIHGGVTELLALQVGSLADEQAIHRDLRGHAHAGREYYYPTPAVVAVVNEMRSVLGLPAANLDRHAQAWRSQLWSA